MQPTASDESDETICSSSMGPPLKVFYQRVLKSISPQKSRVRQENRGPLLYLCSSANLRELGGESLTARSQELDSAAPLDGQLGISMPNCLAYSACNR